MVKTHFEQQSKIKELRAAKKQRTQGIEAGPKASRITKEDLVRRWLMLMGLLNIASRPISYTRISQHLMSEYTPTSYSLIRSQSGVILVHKYSLMDIVSAEYTQC